MNQPSRYALSTCIAAALLAGCGASQPSISAPVTPSITANAPHKKTFHYTGARQTFVVPSGVSAIAVDAIGAAGAGYTYTRNCYGPCFGLGGRLVATVPVKPGETLYVRVGGAGGFNGGGAGGNGGYWGSHSGGGASDVRESGDRLKDRILVAGGGGGQSTGYYFFLVLAVTAAAPPALTAPATMSAD